MIRLKRFQALTLSIFLTIVSQAALAQSFAVSPSDIVAIEEIVNAKVAHGRFQGLFLNTAIRRPIHIMGAESTDAVSKDLNADSIVVANIFHDGHFYVGRLPVAKLDSVSLLSAPFSPVADHTMLKFNFDKKSPIELLAKINDRQDGLRKVVEIVPLSSPILIQDIVMTIDGTEPLGQKAWNMLDAIRGRYTIAYRLVTVSERFRWFVMRGTNIEQTVLNLDPQEAQKTLRLGLFKSHTLSFSQKYRLLFANCTNLALKLIKEANPLQARNVDRFSPTLQIFRAFFDKIAPGEALTWFTAARIRLLGWVKAHALDLQADPEFRAELQVVLDEYRREILSNVDMSTSEKIALLTDLGIKDEKIIENPKLFRKALKSYDQIFKLREKHRIPIRCESVFI